MTIHKKRSALFAALVCLMTLGTLLGFVLPSSALAWDDCPRGEVDCVYPGDCSRYIDTNGDGICDHSQSDPSATTTTIATEESVTDTQENAGTDAAVIGAASAATADSTTTTTLIASSGRHGRSSSAATATPTTTASAAVNAASTAAVTADESGGVPFFTHYLVSPIALGFFLVYMVSFVLYKTKRMRVTTHRKIWNVLLTATFLITGIFGVILAIQLDYELPFTIPIDLLFWHVEAGIVMTLISLFHMGWHFNYYRNLLRTSRNRARAARAAERRSAAAARGVMGPGSAADPQRAARQARPPQFDTE